MGPQHWGTAFKKARAALRAERRQPCVLCGQAIDYRLRAPASGSFAAEHVIPARLGGDHTTLAPSHLGCQRRQGGLVSVQQRAARDRRKWTSGTW